MRNTQANVTSKTHFAEDLMQNLISIRRREILRTRRRSLLEIMFFLFSLSIGFAGLIETAAAQSKIQMTDDSIVELIQKQSFSYREQNLKKISVESIEQTTLLPYRWNLNLDTSREEDRTDSTSTFISPNSLKYRNAFTLSKKFDTGTNLQLDFQNIDYRTGNSAGDYNLNGLTASLEQNLYPFFKTNTDQMIFDNARLEKDRATLQWSSDKISSLRNVMALYWQVKALNVSVIENASVFKKYESLVAAVKKKKSNNFATAGELEQAYAEFLAREQQLKEDQNSLSQRLLDLRSELGLPPETQLDVDLKLKPVKMPSARAIQLEHSTPFQIQNLKYKLAKNLAEVASIKENGRLSLYGKLNPVGVDNQFSKSWNEFSQSEKNKYTVGIKFDYVFDDLGSAKDAEYKRATELLEQNRLEELEHQLGDQIDLQYKNLSIGYQAIQNAAEIVENRVAALDSIYKSYLQGRIDISNLIDAYNKMVTSKVNLYKSYGSFYDKWLGYQQLFIEPQTP